VAGCTEGTVDTVAAGIAFRSVTGHGERQVTRGGYDSDPAWSPNGKYVAFLRHTSRGDTVGLLDASGRLIRLLARPPAYENDAAPVWMPNSRAVLVTREYGVVTAEAKERGQGSENRTSIELLPITGAPRRTLTTVVHLQEVTPSPDGTRLAFLREPTFTNNQYLRAVVTDERDLWTLDIASGRLRQWTHLAKANTPPPSYCGTFGGSSGTLARPQWSPDGRSIAYISTYDHPLNVPGTPEILLLNVSTGSIHRVFHEAPATCQDTSITRMGLVELLGWSTP
jgi:Tol biopolymer transport system component